MPFTTLTDEEEKELYRLKQFYWKEALRCEEAKAYLTGCVMLGSALETLLILMINCCPDEAEEAWRAQKKRGKPPPLLKWTLADMVTVAKAAN